MKLLHIKRVLYEVEGIILKTKQPSHSKCICIRGKNYKKQNKIMCEEITLFIIKYH